MSNHDPATCVLCAIGVPARKENVGNNDGLGMRAPTLDLDVSIDFGTGRVEFRARNGERRSFVFRGLDAAHTALDLAEFVAEATEERIRGAQEFD